MLNDLVIAAVSLLYISVCLAAGKLVLKFGFTTRYNAFHFVRIGITGWVFFAYFGIRNAFVAASIPALLFALNAFVIPRLKRSPVFLSPSSDTRKPDPGPILFPFTAALLTFVFWFRLPDYKFVAAVSLFAAGWGGGAAAIIDHSFGRYKYQVFAKTKSFEGTVTMFLATFIAASALMPTTKMGSAKFLSTSICAAAVATAADNMTPSLTEALAVPLATAAVVLWWALAV
jgi:phytol kinase